MKARISILALSLALASCGSGNSDTAPTGQVVATVNGKEVTSSELELEVPNLPKDPAQAAAIKQAALQNLIARKLLAAAAVERKLDTTPVAAMAKMRADEMMLVQLLESNLAKNVPAVSDAEVTDYIAAHPSTFGQRKLISVDQLLVPTIDPKLVTQMEPLNTLAEVENLLNQNSIRFIRSATVLDSLNLNPEIASQVNKLSTGEVFVSRTGSGVQVAQIVSNRVEPLSGADAQQVARALLTRQRNATQVRSAMEQIVKDGQSKVKLNPQFAPKQPAKAPPAASGAPKP